VTDCTQVELEFPPVKRRALQVNFDGGAVSSDGGVVLLREIDRRLGLLNRVAKVVADPRDPTRIVHSLTSMLKQRVYGLCLGYEDLNDHAQLREDPLLQSAVERDTRLASSATLCRLENRATRTTAWAVHEVMVEQFIASFAQPPGELILDFDATDDPVHGHQEGRFFHGYYDAYCFLPLYVFCGEQLLVSYLRPSKIDAAKHAWAILALLVKRLRAAWPQVRLIMRADSGFCRHKMLSWCERHGVHYVVGLAKNARLNAMSAVGREQLAERFARTQAKQRMFMELEYAADSWSRQRRVIARLEHSDKGDNPRYIVTNLEQPGNSVYEQCYCARGEMENRIKEAQLGLFADRTSCHYFVANQLRLLLSSLAYVLMERLRSLGLAGTEWARLQAGTLRTKLLKVGAVIVRNSRRIRVWLSSAYPYQPLFAHAAAALRSP